MSKWVRREQGSYHQLFTSNMSTIEIVSCRSVNNLNGEFPVAVNSDVAEGFTLQAYNSNIELEGHVVVKMWEG